MHKYIWTALVFCFSCGNLEGPIGPQGPAGPAGRDGRDLHIEIREGTIISYNFTEANPAFASIPLGEHAFEPIVLFFGVENENGVFTRIDYSGVIYGGDDSEYTVRGTTGYYLLVYDSNKTLLQSNYQVKFIPGI